jgi:hypothetical protein
MTDDVECQYAEFRRQTLWELWSKPSLYEPFGDTVNFFSSADVNTRIAMAERLLRELWHEAWARFVRRAGPGDEHGKELNDEEIEAVITSDVWRTSPLRGDAMDVVLVPTEKARSWELRIHADAANRDHTT